MKNLILLGIIGFGVWAYSTGKLESWLAQIEVADKPIEEVTYDELVDIAKGSTLRNAFGASYRVLRVSNLRRVSRSPTQLTCRGSVLLDSGRETSLTMKMKDVEGERFFEFSSN